MPQKLHPNGKHPPTELRKVFDASGATTQQSGLEACDVTRLLDHAKPRRGSRHVLLDGHMWDIDIFILQNSTSGIADALTELTPQLNSVTVFGDARSAFQCMRHISELGAVFLVDIDVFETTETAVEELIALRRNAALLSVIVASHSFLRNDFSSERKTIADASIRLPTMQDMLAESVQSALQNTARRLTLPGPLAYVT